MSKVLELESGTDPIDQEQQKKNDVEQMIQGTMKKAYILGLSSGARTMCIQFLGKMTEIKKLNPQKQLVVLNKMCLDMMNQGKNNTNENTEKENG